MAATWLTRTQVAGTSRKIFTVSMWIKKTTNSPGREQYLFHSWDDGNNRFMVTFLDSNILQIRQRASASTTLQLDTNRVFRDVNAWYHIVVRVDTTQSTAADRIRMYINGVQETSFSTASYPSQNLDLQIGTTDHTFYLGQYGGGGNNFTGLASHWHFADGQSLAPTVFGSTDPTTGEWNINTSPSVTYGNNGFFLFKDDNSVNDDSGEGHNFTLASGTLTKTEDNPSNVFATWNVLQSQYFWGAADTSFATNGATTLGSGTSQYGFISGTMGINKGKFYWETKLNSETGGSQFVLGIASTMPRSATNHLGGNQYDYGLYSQNGNLYTSNASSSFAGSYTVGDILSVAIDYDNGKLYYAKNGAWATGSGAWGSTTFNASTGAKTITTPPPQPTATPGVGTGFYFPAFSYWDGGNRGFISTNFGNGFFGTTAVSSAGTNASGIGIFEYDVPSGYTALSTKGLNT